MLHRFAMPDLGVEGHDPRALQSYLEYLRARRYAIVDLLDLLNRVEKGIPLERNTIVFTVDDGYADFAEVAAPVFAKYDCPVTVFLVSGFVAERSWEMGGTEARAVGATPVASGSN